MVARLTAMSASRAARCSAAISVRVASSWTRTRRARLNGQRIGARFEGLDTHIEFVDEDSGCRRLIGNGGEIFRHRSDQGLTIRFGDSVDALVDTGDEGGGADRRVAWRSWRIGMIGTRHDGINSALVRELPHMERQQPPLCLAEGGSCHDPHARGRTHAGRTDARGGGRALGVQTYPIARDDVFLGLIGERAPHVYRTLTYGYGALWFITPNFAASFLMSLVAIVVYRRAPTLAVRALPPYPVPRVCHGG